MIADTSKRNNVLEGAWAGALLSLVFGVFLVGYGLHENRQNWLLEHRGKRTQGTLEKVTRTKRSVNFIPIGSSYSFDVSFYDEAAAIRQLHCGVNAELIRKHAVDNTTFTRHEIEVVFLPSDPAVSGLSEMLGLSIFPLLIGGVFVWAGIFLVRGLVRRRI